MLNWFSPELMSFLRFLPQFGGMGGGGFNPYRRPQPVAPQTPPASPTYRPFEGNMPWKPGVGPKFGPTIGPMKPQLTEALANPAPPTQMPFNSFGGNKPMPAPTGGRINGFYRL